MFDLSLLDHLRLTFGHVVYRHKAHAHLARSRAQWSRRLRAAEALLVAGVAVVSINVAYGTGQRYAIVCAVLAVLALAVLLVHLTVDFDGSAQAHASCAARLWQIREQYRALLSDLTDGALELETARQRRDALMSELHGIYQNTPAADAHAYQAAVRAVGAVDEAVLTDEEIDVFLPKSLRKTGKPAAA